MRVAICPAPHRGALLQYLGPRVTDSDLAEIASKDMHEYDAHFRAMARLRSSLRVEGRLHWNPKEAIELERWERPTSSEGHRRRLFACAVLADAYFEESSRNYLPSLSDILAPLVESAVALGEDARLHARQSVSALLEVEFPYWEHSLIFAGLAAALLSAAGARGDESGTIEHLADWVLAEHLRLNLEELSAETGIGILGCTHFNQYNFLWQSLATRFVLDAPLPYAACASEKLRAIGADLARWRSAGDSEVR